MDESVDPILIQTELYLSPNHPQLHQHFVKVKQENVSNLLIPRNTHTAMVIFEFTFKFMLQLHCFGC